MRYRFHAEALEEYADATRRYAGIRAKLGRDYVAEVERSIGVILEYPDAWPPVERGVRRYRTHRFPYCLYYKRVGDEILIIAVAHVSRRPGYWHYRLD